MVIYYMILYSFTCFNIQEYTRDKALKNVIFCNQKGGTGKSTICAELVLSLRRSGIITNFYDLDQQGGTILEPSEVPGAEVSAIDTPGALTNELPDLIHECDVVCIPVRPSALEIDSLMVMLDAYTAHAKEGAKLVIIVNQFTRWKSSRDFLAWVKKETKETGAVIVTMMQSETVIQAGAARMSVIDFAPRSAAAVSAQEVVNVIRKAAGIRSERSKKGVSTK